MLTIARNVESNADLQEQLVRRAWEDQQFAELLRVDPRAAIELETGIEIPSDVKIHVHSENAETLHLVVPAKPNHRDEEIVASGAQTSCPQSCPTVNSDICPPPPTLDGGYDCTPY